MISLERRLRIGLALGLIVLMGIFWLVGNHLIRELSEDSVAERLRLDLWSLEGALVFGDVPPPPRRHSIDAAYDRLLSGHYYLVLGDAGRGLESPSLGKHRLEVPRLGPGESRRMRIQGPAGETLLLLVQGFHRDGEKFTIAVGEDLAPLQTQQWLLLRNFALMAGGGLLLILLLQRLLVRRALGPLERVREDVLRLERGGSPQLSEEVTPELLPLVRDLNHMLAQVEGRLERSRNALGNLAQALKRPLALLIRYLDDEEDEEGRQEIRAGAQLESIQRLTARGIRRVGVSAQGGERLPFDPDGDLVDLAAIQQQRCRERQMELDFRVEKEMSPFGERDEILELLGDLLDNALHRASARMSFQMSGTGEIEIVVEDDGFLPQEWDLQPQDYPLEDPGLATARDIVQLYGGTLEQERSQELGGLQVRVLLPGEGVKDQE